MFYFYANKKKNKERKYTKYLKTIFYELKKTLNETGNKRIRRRFKLVTEITQ